MKNIHKMKLLLFLTTAQIVFCQNLKNIDQVDFNNFTYNSSFYRNIKLVNGTADNGDINISQVKYIDIDSDGKNEAVVILGISVSGSVGYVEEIHIYNLQDGKLVEIYFDSNENPRETIITDNSVVQNCLYWEKHDPHCCPSYIIVKTTLGWKGKIITKSKKIKNY